MFEELLQLLNIEDSGELFNKITYQEIEKLHNELNELEENEELAIA